MDFDLDDCRSVKSWLLIHDHEFDSDCESFVVVEEVPEKLISEAKAKPISSDNDTTTVSKGILNKSLQIINVNDQVETDFFTKEDRVFRGNDLQLLHLCLNL